MDLDKNNLKYYGQTSKKKRKLNKKTLLFLGFLFVIGAIVFTTLYSNGVITGNVASINSNNSIKISSELTSPDFNLKGEYLEIKISSNSKTTIYLGDKSFFLDETRENQIILKEFSGKIEIDGDGILLDGKVSDVNLNYLPITDKNNKKIKISSDSKIPYNLVEFKENLFLKEINYISSGTLSVGKQNPDKITLNRDSLVVSNYLGKLKISEGNLFLDGFAENIKINGDEKKISISK